MKKFNLKSAIIGFLLGTMCLTTVFAASEIKSATFSNAKVTLDGDSIPLINSLVEIVKDNEKDMQLYMPVRELLEYLGYSVNWDGERNSIDLVIEMSKPKVSEMSEAPDIITNKASSNEPMRKYYDDDFEIAKAYKNAYFDSFMGMGDEVNFTSFIGCTSIYEFNMEESSKLTIKFQSDITQGKFKLVLVTTEGKVVNIAETVTPDSINIENTFSLTKGKHTIKIVGLDASGNYILTLSGDAESYGKPIGL